MKYLNDYRNMNEKNYPKLAKTLKGLRDSIYTIGIVSAENPHGKKIPDSENEKRMDSLKKSLVNGFYSYRYKKNR